MKGFIEVNTMQEKFILNCSHIFKVEPRANNRACIYVSIQTSKDCGMHAFEVQESYGEVKELIRNA